MELLPNIITDGCALYLREHKTIVISDLHIGKEEEMRSAGVMIPASQKQYYQKEIARLLQEHDVLRVVFNGDIKHEFKRISAEEWNDVKSLITSLQEKGIVVEIILGNHDNMLVPILNKLRIKGRKELLLGSVLITHGDLQQKELSLDKCSTIIIGHEHPSLLLADGVRSESAKCYLVGEEYGKKMIVMPAFNPLSLGSNVLRERPLGPLLTSYTGFSAFVMVEDEVLAFGLIENIKRHQR